jgi:sulfide:quinone oxidoreductase
MSAEIQVINDEFSVSAQINLEDLQPLAERGVKSLICNRPDGEAADQINVTVGAGAAGISAASSLLARVKDLSIAVIDPAEVHYYQPGWTLVGAGVFKQANTVKTMASLIPEGVEWIKAAVGTFDPEQNRVSLEDSRPVYYERLIVAPGIKLDWHGVEGLAESIGHNGVTSNYRFDLAPYTWKLVNKLKGGRALFTQPPMPIKCAGAPQKALYLSCDHWSRTGVLDNIEVEFYNAGEVLFGVKEYVPALMSYIERYQAQLKFGHKLVGVDGESKKAWFETAGEDGSGTDAGTHRRQQSAGEHGAGQRHRPLQWPRLLPADR